MPAGNQILFVPACILLLAVTGCASLWGAGSSVDPKAVYDAVLGSNPVLTAMRAEAEVTISFMGKGISLPGVVLLRKPDNFRVDLLDPLDRPAVLIFAEGESLVQYRPAASLAFSLKPFPPGCREGNQGAWVAAVLAGGKHSETRGRYRVRSFWGRNYLERYREGELQERIRYREEETGAVPVEATWFCDGEPALRVELRDYRTEGSVRLPGNFTVSFPLAHLTISFRLGPVEGNPRFDEGLFHPRLGPGTQRKHWKFMKDS